MMLTMLSDFYALFGAEEGQGLVEYALILILVSIAAVASLTALGGQLNTLFTTVTGNLAAS